MQLGSRHMGIPSALCPLPSALLLLSHLLLQPSLLGCQLLNLKAWGADHTQHEQSMRAKCMFPCWVFFGILASCLIDVGSDQV